jgi:hypothetical protein
VHSENDNEQFILPDYAVIVTDDREHNIDVAEIICMGQFFDNGDRWAFYKAFDYEYPSMEELKNIKGIVFPGSKYSVYDTSINWL